MAELRPITAVSDRFPDELKIGMHIASKNIKQPLSSPSKLGRRKTRPAFFMSRP